MESLINKYNYLQSDIKTNEILLTKTMKEFNSCKMLLKTLSIDELETNNTFTEYIKKLTSLYDNYVNAKKQVEQTTSSMEQITKQMELLEIQEEQKQNQKSASKTNKSRFRL